MLIFKTPTIIDLRAITTFGLNSKPNTNSPIGYFGTGLKYALAVACREGIQPELHIQQEGKPLKKYLFYTKHEEFRDKSFSFVYMKEGSRNKWFSKEHALPFTTEYGKNWTFWQIFREMHSNTLDEQGITYCTEDLDITDKEYTAFVFRSKEMEQEYVERDKTFLPEAFTDYSVKFNHAAVQVLEGSSKYIYYRGVRVYDLDTPSLYTWNFLSQKTLTEDRTLKNIFEVNVCMQLHLAECTDKTLLDSLMDCGTDFYEGRLDWSYLSATPSKEFMELVSTRKIANNSLWTYGQNHLPKEPSIEVDWRKEVVSALKTLNQYDLIAIIESYKENLIQLLEKEIYG